MIPPPAHDLLTLDAALVGLLLKVRIVKPAHNARNFS